MRFQKGRVKHIKLSILLVVLLCFSLSVSAYRIKYYSPSINQEECLETIGSIPQSYFQGMKQISIMNIDSHSFLGEYYPHLIYITNGCDKQVLIHELAHHLQFVRGDTWNELITHRGHFLEYLEEIALESY